MAKSYARRILIHKSRSFFLCQMDDIDLSKFLVAKKQPKFRSDCYYGMPGRIWATEELLPKAKKTEKESVQWKRVWLACENCPSNVSKCRVCGSAINKTDVRFAYPITDPRGNWGIISAWLHLNCAGTLIHHIYETYICDQQRADACPQQSEEGLESFLQEYCCGFSDYNNEQRQTLMEALRKGQEEVQNIEMEDFVQQVLTKRHPPPPDLTTSLLPFQEEGLAWMAHQEESQVRGGILADEMGMGKTIQAIALMLARKVKAGAKGEGANLVVAPLAAVLQWQGEIERFTERNALTVLIYHGQNRKILVNEIHKADVVITTYSTIEADYRRIVNKHKLRCEYCNRFFLPTKLRIHQLYWCGPDAVRTFKQSKQKRKTVQTNFETPTIINVYREIMIKAGRFEEAEDLSGAPWLGYHRSRSKPALESEDPAADYDDAIAQIKATGPFQLHTVPVVRLKELAERAQLHFEAKMKKLDLIALIRKQIFEIVDDGRAPKKPASKSLDTSPAKQSPTGSSSGSPSRSPQSAQSAQESPDKVTRKRRISSAIDLETNNKKVKAEVKMETPMKTGGDSEPKGPKNKLTVKTQNGKVTKNRAKVSSSSGSSPNTTKPVSRARSALHVMACSGSSVGGSAYDDSSDVTYDDTGSDSEEVSLTSSAEKSPSEYSCEPKAGCCGSVGESDSKEDVETYMEDDMDLSGSLLHSIRWNRIILDEAHRIKSGATSTSKSILSLTSEFRWCLSGTPLQNRVSELYSLIRFIRFEPYGFYYCSKNGCDCKIFNYSFKENKFCDRCGHSRLQHYSYFNKKIARPIVAFGFIGQGQFAFQCLKNEVLAHILLRRTKVQKHDDIKLPPLEVLIRQQKLTDQEMDFYQALYNKSKVQFDTYAEAGTLLHNFAHIFDLLSTLRQAVDHPYLILYGSRYAGKDTKCPVGKCGICLDDLEAQWMTSSLCEHHFHRLCLREFIESAPEGSNLACPICYSSLTIDLSVLNAEESCLVTPSKVSVDSEESAEELVATEGGAATEDNNGWILKTDKVCQPSKYRRGLILSRVKASEFQSSTKIELLVNELEVILGEDSKGKSIVFSQFTTMLELIEFRLKQCGISCVKLIGGLSMESTHNILTAFNTDESLSVILISLKAGGEGLNLQIASNIFIMDPWWNPAAEMQAIQRAHRIGQKKAVRGVRFIAAGTIEERILQLQEKKQLVFDGVSCYNFAIWIQTVGSSVTAIQKLSADDLRFLFQ